MSRPFSIVLPEWSDLRFDYNGSRTIEVIYAPDESPLDAISLSYEDRKPTISEVLNAIFERADEAAA